ncbi:MAG: multidrug efflux RND transporter permease subunit [Elusimicrobia bacterium]|nr:multidrug efflux RND transporter permease subunit [Elusimicrobiota bacterium]
MFSKIFINRPILAAVIALLIVLAGVLSMFSLPVEQYPNLVPPTVLVRTAYLGADPEVLSSTVAAPLEEQVNGVEKMLYMNSASDSYGNMNLTVYFQVGSDPDLDTINVNNLVQQALPSLPQDVQRYGVSVIKKSTEILQIFSIVSPDNVYDTTYMANYALVNIVDALKRIDGVGDVQVLSANNYSIRIWIKPDKLAQYKLTPADVIAAVSAQNQQRAAGIIGEAPEPDSVVKSYVIKAPGRLETPAEFEQIILRAMPDGSSLFLKDVADIELGSQTYSFRGVTNKEPAVPVAVYLTPGANAVATADRVLAAMNDLSSRFPSGMSYVISYDTTPFVKESIKEVIKTILTAVILVFIVVYIFLQDFRATLIPCIAVPVSIIGAFAGMSLLGFSINTLTLFGLVLAIGMVVDDAIVVIENVERIMREEKLDAKEATIKAMEQVQMALIAIVCVLCSVFIPVSFMGGFTGILYKQFAITIVVSVVISGFVALTLTPALCALLLKNDGREPKGLFAAFNKFFKSTTKKYSSGVAFFIKNIPAAAVSMLIILVLSFALLKNIPTGLLPSEDRGVALLSVTMDPATALANSAKISDSLEELVLKHPAAAFALVFTGTNILNGTQTPSAAAAYVRLKPWNERKGKAMSVDAFISDIQKEAFMKIPGAAVFAFNLPPINGMSTTGGLEAYIQNRGDQGGAELAAQTQKFINAVKERPEIASIITTFSNIVPQYDMSVNIIKALSKGVSLDDLYTALQSTFGTYYINDFTKYNRNFKVMMQSRGDYRKYPEQINNIYVHSGEGQMMPLSELVTLKPVLGSEAIERFNVFPAAKIIATPARGVSAGTAIKILEDTAAKTLGSDFTLAWTGTAYQEKAISGSSAGILLLGIFVVFLILCALYEKWGLPFAVILAIPFGIFGALSGTWARGLENDIYFQIALVTLIGLSAKNAILIVEFAQQLREKGAGIFDAAMQAARLRFRPIIMTSLAFIFGTLPLALSSGAGAASRHSIGTAVVFGMTGATIIAPLLVPLFFFIISGGLKKKTEETR